MMQISKLKMTQLVRDSIRMNWMVWHGLLKKTSQLLASSLNEKNLLEKEEKVSYFPSKESSFLQYFRSDSCFVYQHNIQGLLQKLGIPMYNWNEWWLFIDSLKRSLKHVLHDGNQYGAVPIGDLVSLQGEHGDIKSNWVVTISQTQLDHLYWPYNGRLPSWSATWLYQESAFCEYGLTELEIKHWVARNWLSRPQTWWSQYTTWATWWYKESCILASAHQTGFNKKFVKALKTEGDCFKYLILAFPGLSVEKIKAGVFDGPQIWQLIKDDNFIRTISELEKNTWS